jgi:hypothetical protein
VPSSVGLVFCFSFIFALIISVMLTEPAAGEHFGVEENSFRMSAALLSLSPVAIVAVPAPNAMG